ncbi:hypothetical protein Tco_1153988 [Tanacetum coccineum]
MRCTHGRNVRLLEVEETLMVDIDWINLQSCDEETLRIPCLAKVRQRKDLGGKRCGFVQLTQRSCDEEALRIPQGTQFGGETVRLSWWHSLASSEMQILLGVLKLEFERNYVLPAVLYARSDLHAVGVYVTSSTMSGHGYPVATVLIEPYAPPKIHIPEADVVWYYTIQCAYLLKYEHLLAEILRMEKEGAIQS